MSAAAADVMNRDRELDGLFDVLEADAATMSYILTRAEKAYRLMSAQARKGKAGHELHELIGWCRARRWAMQGELMRLRQAED